MVLRAQTEYLCCVYTGHGSSLPPTVPLFTQKCEICTSKLVRKPVKKNAAQKLSVMEGE